MNKTLFKKTILSIATFSLAITGLNSANHQNYDVKAAARYIAGDIDGNGSVNVSDLTGLIRFLNGANITTDANQMQRLDVNGDHIYDQEDYELLKSAFLGDTRLDTREYSYETEQDKNNKICGYGLPKFQNIKYNVYDGKSHKFLNSYSIAAPSTLRNSSSSKQESSKTDRTCWFNDLNAPETDNNVLGIILINGGTGFVVDSHTILTAAHCISNRSKNQNGDLDIGDMTVNIKRYRDKNGKVVTGEKKISAKYVHLPEKYISTDIWWQYDYAMVTVEEDLSQYFSKDDFFSLAMVDNSVMKANPDVYVTGYSPEIVTARGKIRNVFDMTIDYDAQGRGGTSGGPVYIKTKTHKNVIGINTHGNYGNRVNPEMVSFVLNNKNYR